MTDGMCAKVRYRDELAAKLAMARIGRKRHERRPGGERRAYPCPSCRGAWHLTSRGGRPGGGALAGR